MNRQRFEDIVIRAIDELPAEFQEQLENVGIVIEDSPTPQQLRKLGITRAYDLLGLYEGVPQTKRGRGYNLAPPDKITIFQKPIERRCNSEKEIENEIGSVVRHEIAHHFGIGDDTLHKIEGQKRRRTGNK